MGIEENGVVLEVWPLEHTPQFRYIFLSVRRHWGPTVSTPLSHTPSSLYIHCLSSPMNTICGNEVLYSPWWIVVIEPIDEAEIVAVGEREGQLGSTAAGIRTPYADSCHGGAMQLVICGTLLP